jgi:hypothetical protein
MIVTEFNGLPQYVCIPPVLVINLLRLDTAVKPRYDGLGGMTGVWACYFRPYAWIPRSSRGMTDLGG